MIEKILERFEKRKDRWIDLANQSNFDGYAQEEKEYLLMANEDEKLIEIVQEVAKEYGNASDNDLMVVSALPSLYPLQPFEEEAIQKVVASAKDCGWIPVEEKNPTLFESVYVTCISLVDERPSWVIEGIYGTEGWHGMSYMLCWGEAKVIAWMPKELPAPYQKGE